AEERARLLAELPSAQEWVRQAEAFVRHMEPQWWNPWQQERARQELAAAQENLRRLQEAIDSFDPRQFLEITPDSIARAVESGFDMADPSRLGESLEGVIRDALVRAWATS